MNLIFWTCVLLVLYVYIGYPVMLCLRSQIRKRVDSSEGDDPEVWPEVTLIITAYNEAQDIQAKLENTLTLDYPKDRLEIIVASDGSTDSTNDIVKAFGQGVKLLAFDQNRGKAATQNDAIRKAAGEIIILSDATGRYSANAIKELVRHFINPEIGAVAGRVQFRNVGASSNTSHEGLYWRYECMIRDMESDLGILTATSGSILAFRKLLFKGLDPAISDDFVIPMQVLGHGKQCILEPEAVSVEELAEQDKDQFHVKVRTITLDVRGLFLMKHLMNPFKYPLVAWSLISHKLLRWSVGLFMIGILITNLFLLDQPLYQVFMGLQILFYGLACIGAMTKSRFRGFTLPWFFCMINAAALVGFYRNIRGQNAATWKPVR